MRTASVTLWRAIPPFRKRVTIGPITVRSFRDAIKRMGDRVFEFARLSGGDEMLTTEQVWKALGDWECFSDIADLIVMGERRGFWKTWSTNRNASALMAGVVEVETPEGIARMWGLLDWTGERVKKGGGFNADLEIVARLDHVSPVTLFETPMRDFLDRCDLLKEAAAMGYSASHGDDPTLDPSAEPTPLPN
jgi:hypothetical protein